MWRKVSILGISKSPPPKNHSIFVAKNLHISQLSEFSDFSQNSFSSVLYEDELSMSELKAVYLAFDFTLNLLADMPLPTVA